MLFQTWHGLNKSSSQLGPVVISQRDVYLPFNLSTIGLEGFRNVTVTFSESLHIGRCDCSGKADERRPEEDVHGAGRLGPAQK